MAIGVSSIVAVKISSPGLALGNVTAQAPSFGVSETASTPFTVVWSDSGNRVAAIVGTSLDEILNPSTPTQDLLGQVVTIEGASAAFSGLVIGVYSRSTIDCVLMKNLQTGCFIEAAASAVTVVPGL